MSNANYVPSQRSPWRSDTCPQAAAERAQRAAAVEQGLALIHKMFVRDWPISASNVEALSLH